MSLSEASKSRVLTGKDVITTAIFSAIYFVLNMACMLISGLHPMLWILMPAFIAVLTGIPFLLLCAKVQKPGAVLLMGLITGLIYTATGQFTPLILITFVIACGAAELVRIVTRYSRFWCNALAFVLFSQGMTGSPLPIWLMRGDFLAQLAEQGMPAAYVQTLANLSSPPMLIVLFAAPVAGALIGILLAKVMFRKHFEKAGMV